MKNGAEGQSGNVFLRPDRSCFRPRLDRTDKIYELDLGWGEGCFSDGRPYRAELWAWNNVFVVTFYFSNAGLEKTSTNELLDLLKKENLLYPLNHNTPAAEIVRDASENEMWSLSVPLVRDGRPEAKTDIRFRPYAGYSQPEKISFPSNVISFIHD